MENSNLTDLLSTAFDEGGHILASTDQQFPAVWDQSTEPTSRPLKAHQPETPTNPWDPRFVLDLALAVDELPDILSRYDISEDEFKMLSDTPLFRRELAVAMREVRENGVSFACKARVQAESYLEVMDELVYDAATPANVRLETIRSAVKWARLEPKEDKAEGAGTGAVVNVQINF